MQLVIGYDSSRAIGAVAEELAIRQGSHGLIITRLENGDTKDPNTGVR